MATATDEKIEITIPAEMARRIQEHLTLTGQKPDDYLLSLAAKDLAMRPTFEEIFAPVAENFARTGMTEEEFDEFIDSVREEIYQEQKAAS